MKWGWKSCLISIALWEATFPGFCEATRKDFKGLFGSYRRERFTENEARSTDIGVDLLLSTLFPISAVVSSSEDRSKAVSPMQTVTFFNVEASFFLSIRYHWELFLNLGYYTYETRKENSIRNDPALPLFHQFEMDAFPAILGVKYRLSTEDIVPYLGLGVGFSYVRRKGFYDYNPVTFDQEYSNAITAEIILGLEFYFSSRAGIRLETSAFHFRLPNRTFDPSGPTGNAASFPILTYQGNPWLIRYASGLFFLF